MASPRSFPRRVAVAVAAVLVALATASAQQPPATPEPAQPTFRTGVNLVRVDVSVFGRDGAPVDDLTPADFLVEEDGVPQKVETVQFVRLTGQTPPELRESTSIRSPEHAAVEAARDDVRLFVLFLDDYHVDKAPQIMIPLKRTLKAFVDRLGPYDLVAVMDPLTPLTHVEFTRDHNRLLEIVGKFEGRRGELFPVRSAAEEAQQTQRNIWELRAGVTLDALNAIVTRLGGMREGRKSVLFVSQGPPVSLRSINWPRLEEVVQSANRANVTIHTLDPRPLGLTEFGGNYVLRRLADETGGRAIFNTNDHVQHLDGVIEDASAYYLVGYAPSREEMADGKYHKITVDVKRPRVRVVARRGYWSPSAREMTAAARVTPVNEEVAAALRTLVEPRDGSTAEVWVGYERGTREATDVTIAWAPLARGGSEPARLAIERFNVDGSSDGETMQLAPPDPAQVGDNTPPGVATLSLPPGPTVLRFTTYDKNGDVLDRWPLDLQVPDIAGEGLALATPRFLLARSPFELRALRGAEHAPPAASRRLRKSDRLLVDLAAYPAASSPEFSLELLNQQGESLVSLPVKANERGRSRVEIPLQSLAPATYVLKVTARAGGEQVEEHAPFRIVP